MNKKVLVLALVLVLAVTSVFAVKSDMKVGAQLGYGGRSFTYSVDDEDSKFTILGNGFYGAFTFEYGVTDAISVKAEAGINTMGHAKVKNGSGHPEDDATPANFTIFVGAMYNYAINKEISAYGGAGVDMMIGNIISSNKSSNTGIGLGLELGATYKINKQISVNVGGKFGWHFINTNEEMKDDVSDKLKITGLTYKAYAGVTYSL